MFQQEVTIYKVDENTSIGFLPRVYFCNEIDLYRKDCIEASATSFGSKKLPLKNTAENPVPRSFLVAAGYVTKYRKYRSVASNIGYQALSVLAQFGVLFERCEMSTKVQYCGSSKHLDWISFVWELIFWYYIDILLICMSNIKLASSYEVNDSCSIIFSSKFCTCYYHNY